MSIEHLQLVLNLLKDMGAEGKDLFIWWFAITKSLDLVFGVLGFSFGFYVVRKVFILIKQGSQDFSEFEQLKKAANKCYFTFDDLQTAKKILRDHFYVRPDDSKTKDKDDE